MVPTNQRWAFMFDRPPDNGGVRANGSAQLLINVVNGIVRPFTILDSEIDDIYGTTNAIIYRLVPDDGYKDDPSLETELMPEYINNTLTYIALIVEEVNA